MFRKTSRASVMAFALFGAISYATAQEPKQADGNQKQITNSIGMKLTLIPAGEFKMGSGESAEETKAFFARHYEREYGPQPQNAFKNEHPQHRVRITKPFYLGTYHVTRGQFRQFVEDSGYKTDAENGSKLGPRGWDPRTGVLVPQGDISWRNAGFEQTDEHPVVVISWYDAIAFCKWLSRKEGKAYRLPTEAEWEYACRAGTTTRYYSDDDPETLVKVANVADATIREKFPKSDIAKCAIKGSDGYAFTSPVGQFKPNAFGLYDMLGEAWQLCADVYDRGYYGKSPDDDPKGPVSKEGERVCRGGSCLSSPDSTRSAMRGITIEPSVGTNVMGFRVVREAE